jgi:DNA-binding MarR family transcriptional regulator
LRIAVPIVVDGHIESFAPHRRAPAETDIQKYFRASPPSVHQMVLSLERAGLIERLPRTPRTIEVLVDPKDLPELI